jgi:hypothetical protein
MMHDTYNVKYTEILQKFLNQFTDINFKSNTWFKKYLY